MLLPEHELLDLALPASQRARPSAFVRRIVLAGGIVLQVDRPEVLRNGMFRRHYARLSDWWPVLGGNESLVMAYVPSAETRELPSMGFLELALHVCDAPIAFSVAESNSGFWRRAARYLARRRQDDRLPALGLIVDAINDRRSIGLPVAA